MSVLWVEGFESFGTTIGAAPIGIASKYESSNIVANFTVREGRFTGSSLRIRGGGAQIGYLTTPNLGNVATICTGFAFKRVSTLVDFRIVGLRESDDATEGVNLRGRGDGKLDLYNGNTLLATTTEAHSAADSWRHIELKVTVAEAGSYELRVNGVTVLSGTSVDTRAGSNDYCNRVRLYGRDELATAGNQFDDWFVATDFLGDRKVVTIFPDADGDSTDFTPSTPGDHFAMVDDNPPDDDDTYVEADTPGQSDLYTHQNLSGAASIIAVQANIVAKKTDVTDFDMHLTVKSGETESDGDAITVNTTDYANYTRILETDPDTGVAWTPAGLNSAQIGPKVG